MEAEDFAAKSATIQIEASTDPAGGIAALGFITPGSFAEYTVDVPEGGVYTISYRVSNQISSDSTITLSSDGFERGVVAVDPTGSWHNWETINMTLDLAAGEQTIRLDFDSSAQYVLNLNWFGLTLN